MSYPQPLPYDPSASSMAGALPPAVEAQMSGPAAAAGYYEMTAAEQQGYPPHQQEQQGYPPPPQEQQGYPPQQQEQTRPPKRPGDQQQLQAQRPTQGTLTPALMSTAHDIRTVQSSSQFALREYLTLIKKRQTAPYGSTMSLDLEDRIRIQGGLLLGDLNTLRDEVGEVIKACQGRRVRRWILGGALASFIPGVKAIMRRIYPRDKDADGHHPANSTEHAYRKSMSLMARINEAVLGRGGIAQFAMFVVSLLWVFQNEVSLQVAKTVHRRLRRLCTKLEQGGGVEVNEADMKVLQGWRWRVLLWGKGSSRK